MSKKNTGIDIQKLIIKDYKDLVSEEQLQEMLMTTDVLLQDTQEDEEKKRNLELLGYKEIKDIKFKTIMPQYVSFLNKENDFTFINLELEDKEKNKNRVLTYIYKQENHNYEVILWVETTKTNWFKRTFTKNKFKNVDLKLFYKGEISNELKALV